MASVPIIELAYDYLKKVKLDSKFEDILKSISKDIKNSNLSESDIIADLYTELVLDNRFALTEEGNWGLRDYIKVGDLKKQSSFVDALDTTDDFEDLTDDKIFDDSNTNDNLDKIKTLSKDDNFDIIDDEDDDDEDDDDEDDDDEDDDLVEDSYDDEDDY